MSIVAGSNKGRRPYPPQFKREAVELYRRSGRSIVTIAGEIGVAPESLRKWNLQHEVDTGEREGLTSDERARLTELERENQRLRMERDLLKRAAAFFAKETETR
jgi:transposase